MTLSKKKETTAISADLDWLPLETTSMLWFFHSLFCETTVAVHGLLRFMTNFSETDKTEMRRDDIK